MAAVWGLARLVLALVVSMAQRQVLALLVSRRILVFLKYALFTSITSEYESVVMAHARYLRANPNARVVLHGHTDERGTREYNMALGERRAGAVQRFLNIQGVSPSQMSVVSYGEERPAVSGQNESAYSQNRRVVFNY